MSAIWQRPTSREFTMRKNDDRKAGAKRRRPSSSLVTPAEGALGGIQSPRRGGRSDPAALWKRTWGPRWGWAGHTHPGASFTPKPQTLNPESLSTDHTGLCGPSRKYAFYDSSPGILFCLWQTGSFLTPAVTWLAPSQHVGLESSFRLSWIMNPPPSQPLSTPGPVSFSSEHWSLTVMVSFA